MNVTDAVRARHCDREGRSLYADYNDLSTLTAA